MKPERSVGPFTCGPTGDTAWWILDGNGHIRFTTVGAYDEENARHVTFLLNNSAELQRGRLVADEVLTLLRNFDDSKHADWRDYNELLRGLRKVLKDNS